LFVVAIAGIVDRGCRFRVSNVFIFACRDDRRANLEIDDEARVVVIIIVYYLLLYNIIPFFFSIIYETIIAIKLSIVEHAVLITTPLRRSFLTPGICLLGVRMNF